MKTFIIGFLMLISTISLAQDSRRFEIVDSLKTARTSVLKDIEGFLYSSIIFDQIAPNDSVMICMMTDSLDIKHNRDTIRCYLRNLSTYTETASGLITNLSTASTYGGVEIAFLNPNIRKIWIKMIDATTIAPTIYFRLRGIAY